jgi:hypothetical protein
VHLRDLYALGNLPLGHALVETKLENGLFSLGERIQGRCQGEPVQGELKIGINGAHVVGQRNTAVRVNSLNALIKGTRISDASQFGGCQDFLFCEITCFRQFRNIGPSAKSGCNRLAYLVDGELVASQSPGNLDQATVIPEVVENGT